MPLISLHLFGANNLLISFQFVGDLSHSSSSRGFESLDDMTTLTIEMGCTWLTKTGTNQMTKYILELHYILSFQQLNFPHLNLIFAVG